MTTFGQRIKELRRERGWTHNNLADRVRAAGWRDFDGIHLSKIEAGRVPPPQAGEQLNALSGAFCVGMEVTRVATFMLDLAKLAAQPFTPEPPPDPGALIACARGTSDMTRREWERKLARWNEMSRGGAA